MNLSWQYHIPSFIFFLPLILFLMTSLFWVTYFHQTGRTLAWCAPKQNEVVGDYIAATGVVFHPGQTGKKVKL